MVVTAVWSLGALRGWAMAPDPKPVFPLDDCAARVQIFDGVSSVLACQPGACDGDRLTRGLVAPGRMAGPALRMLGLKVDVNRGSVEDLEGLPGVGPKTAERMVAARPFGRVVDLQAVAGIGPKRFSELQGAVTVDPVVRRFCADHL